jgi:hypothetical protein
MKNCYNVLGLKEGASLNEIKEAYREYAKHYHPDKQGGSNFFKKRFQEIQEAYDYLLINYKYTNPIIVDFHVSKNEISNGDFIEVFWETENAKSVTLCIERGNNYEKLNYYGLSNSGKKKFKILNFDNEFSIYLFVSSLNEKEGEINKKIIIKKTTSQLAIYQSNNDDKYKNNTNTDKKDVFVYVVGRIVGIIGGIFIYSLFGAVVWAAVITLYLLLWKSELINLPMFNLGYLYPICCIIGFFIFNKIAMPKKRKKRKS